MDMTATMVMMPDAISMAATTIARPAPRRSRPMRSHSHYMAMC